MLILFLIFCFSYSMLLATLRDVCVDTGKKIETSGRSFFYLLVDIYLFILIRNEIDGRLIL